MSAVPPEIPSELAQAYADTLFIIEAGTGKAITCEVGEVPPAPLPADTVAVITAWNPALERPDEEENRAANDRLECELQQRGYNYLPAVGRSRDGAHEEPSFAVLNLLQADAVSLGRRYGQAAIFWISDGLGKLVWC